MLVVFVSSHILVCIIVLVSHVYCLYWESCPCLQSYCPCHPCVSGSCDDLVSHYALVMLTEDSEEAQADVAMLLREAIGKVKNAAESRAATLTSSSLSSTSAASSSVS